MLYGSNSVWSHTVTFMTYFTFVVISINSVFHLWAHMQETKHDNIVLMVLVYAVTLTLIAMLLFNGL